MSVIRFEQDGALGHVILDGPPFNWVGDAYRTDLRQAIHAASETDIRALLIRAIGPDFSSGGAVHEWVGKSPGWMRTFMADIHAAYRSIEALRLPVVAAVRGNIVGGGVELALACDFIVASSTTVLWSPEIMGGMIPLAGAVQRLVERVGKARALRITMLGEKTPISDVPAVADYIVPDDELDRFALDFATRLSQGPTMAYAATKAVLKAYSVGGIDLADRMLEDITSHLFQTSDVAIGMAGFVPVYMPLGAPGAAPPAGGFDLPQADFTGA